jgi:hypothetical protein
VNVWTRQHNVPFYGALLLAGCGIVFVDLIKHTFLVNTPAPGKDANKLPPVPTQKTEVYCSLADSIKVPYGTALRPRQAKKVSPILPLSFGKLVTSMSC